MFKCGLLSIVIIWVMVIIATEMAKGDLLMGLGKA